MHRLVRRGVQLEKVLLGPAPGFAGLVEQAGMRGRTVEADGEQQGRRALSRRRHAAL